MKSKTPLLFCLIITIFICLDLLFIYIAKTNYAGVVTENSYHKGLKSLTVNNLITEDFKVYVNYFTDELKISLECKHLNCKLIKDIDIKIGRPVTHKFDKNYHINSIKNNRYVIPIDVLSKGQWDVKLKINFENESKYFSKRLIID